MGSGIPEGTGVVTGVSIIEKMDSVVSAVVKSEVVGVGSEEDLWPACPWENGEEVRGFPTCHLHDLEEAAAAEVANGETGGCHDIFHPVGLARTKALYYAHIPRSI